MTELDKGDQKVEGKIKDLILKVAKDVASGFAVEDKKPEEVSDNG